MSNDRSTVQEQHGTRYSKICKPVTRFELLGTPPTPKRKPSFLKVTVVDRVDQRGWIWCIGGITE